MTPLVRCLSSVLHGGKEPKSSGRLRGSDEHANALQLQRWILSTAIVCRDNGRHVVRSQQAGDQFGLREAAACGTR